MGGQIENLPVKEGDRARETCIVAEVVKREARRLRSLRKKNLTSEEKVDKADGASQAKLAACEAANTVIKISQSKIDVAQAQLARTRLIAPFNGRVAEVNGELGEFLTPSPIGIATLPAIDLIDYTCLYVSAPIDEVDAPQIRAQMPARISLDAFAGKTFNGTVRRVAVYVLDREKQSHTVEIEVEFNHIKDTINMLPGYSADAEVILDKREKVLRIPTMTLFERNKVLILNADGLLEQRQIKAGISNWSYTEVLDGLTAGEQIVTSIEREGVAAGVRAFSESHSGD